MLPETTRDRGSTRTRRAINAPKFENILEKVGEEGRHQKILLYGVLLPLAFYIPFGSSSLQLLLSTPDHHCRVPAREAFNVSHALWRKITIPWTRGSDGRARFSRCLMRNITFLEEVEPGLTSIAIDPHANTSCQYGYLYDRSTWWETASTHYDWVCDDAFVVPLIFCVSISANAVGTLLFSFLADRCGRRPVFFTCLSMSTVFGLVNLVSYNWQVFVVTKFLSSLPFFALYQIPYIILVEQCSARMRSSIVGLCAVSITLGMCCLGLFAWLIGHWRKLGLLCYLPAVLFYFYSKILPESPRWLISRGRTEQCIAVLDSIAIRNRRTYSNEVLQMLGEMCKIQRRPPRLLSVMTVPCLRKRTIIVILNTSILCVVYSGISYNIRNVTSNEFLNFFALSLVDIPGNLLGMVSAQFLGRRLTAVYSQFIATGFCFVASVTTTNQLALTVLCSLGKLFLTSTVVVVFMQVGELFPTPLRAFAYGLTGAFGLVSSVCMPSIMALGFWNPRLPYCILGVLCLVGASISSLLPETLGRPLPQNTPEANSIGSGHRFCACVHHWNVHEHNIASSNKSVSDDEMSQENLTSRTFV
ncbi:Major facilitator sugar transporter-like [Trinorchestia longiramus]|nr:Major facilitator sugar transporter-like [Trinorchestia longiramus]